MLRRFSAKHREYGDSDLFACLDETLTWAGSAMENPPGVLTRESTGICNLGASRRTLFEIAANSRPCSGVDLRIQEHLLREPIVYVRSPTVPGLSAAVNHRCKRSDP